MRIKLLISESHYDLIEQELVSKGFEIDDDADLILTEKDLFVDHLIVREEVDHLIVREEVDNERVRIGVDEIIVIESSGHDIVIHTSQGRFKTRERLYQLERLLSPKQFIRVSNSVIIAVNKIKRIKPTLSSKFILKMSNGQSVDVTRSYCGIFKDRLGI